MNLNGMAKGFITLDETSDNEAQVKMIWYQLSLNF